ncbi:hypothetical protein D7B24_008594 [Verticillium nonalfalfae]|uniref:TM7S3/TM198-like domain-containing protein n=1 Tax=Verticillium nonalfalfae TaxID=1051616 RepID=A0A3M9Y8D7_9PEZI|nr:uncharacterized protein D7B24_008594 [Verticillium nonalfalfae]RNJ55370.1 hypothetical protein D7B24_008594 [Verticillium nonalfalfae]
MSKGNRLLAFLCLVLLFHVAASRVLDLEPRQQDGPQDASPSLSPSPTQRASQTGEVAPTTTNGSSDDEETGSASPRGSATSASDNASVAPTPSGLSEDDSNIDLFNATIPEGQLPLQPEITPGWAVSGVLLLLSGAVYTLIGIKNTWLHTFFSTAYLASLGTAVLIVYVMEPPISSGIQGAYVVAVALTGLILGGVTTFFKEVTEGLGCMLGGFCLSMWLLCLRPGGLFHASSSKIVFIACLTLGSFAFYFSRYTRDYALIVCIAFSGATVAVLGIDCFSRAGLKEFWAYIWDLNDNIFPLGATTYPMTRGIRVEIAAIILIFLAGIISQMKLWRIIKERRAERAAKRAEGQRNLEAEEANVGRQIEAENARERREWERAYGNGEGQSTAGSSDSATDCEKHPEKAVDGKSSRAQSTVQVQAIEMDDMKSTGSAEAPTQKAPGGIMVSPEENDGIVTVRVARDDDTLPAAIGEGGEDLDEKRPPPQDQGVQNIQPGAHIAGYSSAEPTAPAPNVVPLPFKVPNEGEKGLKQDDDRSSVATFAADEVEDARDVNKRHSMAKRLSQSSIQLLRRVSHRTARSIQHEPSHSQEELVIPRAPRGDDDGSVAATMDIASLDGDDRSVAGESRRSFEINAELADKDKTDPTSGNQKTPTAAQQPNVASALANKHISTAETVATDILNATDMEGGGKNEGAGPTAPANRLSMATAVEAAQEEETLAARSIQESPKASVKGKSVASVESTPASLTQERLPIALSRVAMSYRTNEWAKHLSHADMPEPDTLQLNDYVAEEIIANPKNEVARPLNVEELQQTANTGAPAPNPPPQFDPQALTALTRADSRQSSKSPVVPSGARDTMMTSTAAASGVPGLYKHSNQSGPLNHQASVTGIRRSSTNLHIQPITEEAQDVQAKRRNSSGADSFVPSSPVAAFVADRPPVPGVVSYSSPQTLLGQREMFLRNKSNPSLPSMMTMPDVQGAARTPSESGSLYNYPAYASQPLPRARDNDDMPMAQRKELMRQSGLLRSSGSYGSLPPGAVTYTPPPAASAETLAFDSHQPQRYSTLPSEAARNSQLANFRQSVQQDLRAGTPLGGQGSGRETPFHSAQATGAGGNDLKRSLDVQRSLLLSQKEAEAQRREMERWEKERGDRAFAARMQSGDLMEAHRDIMRRMQSKANVKDE